MTTIIREYSSICALAHHIEALPDNRRGVEASTDYRSYDWDMGADFDTALQMGLEGGHWEEGAADLQSVDIDAMAHSVADIMEPAIVHGAQGGAVDVGEFLSGSPECWFALEDTPHQRPVVRIAVCAVPCANMEQGPVMNRGRAILAILEALELQGYSVELTAMFVTQSSEAPTYIEATTIKQAGEPWTPEPVAFALAHPAYPRRLGFRALEGDPDCWKHTTAGYGSGRVSRETVGDYDLYFPYADNPNQWATPTAALSTALELTRKERPDFFPAA